MGSGKTTHGKKLAVLFNLPFVDLDAFVEQQEKQSIHAIFQTGGEEKFRETETKCLLQILNTQPPSVISLGGGTVCFNNNLELIRQNGILVYIELPLAVLMDRLTQSPQTRPLFNNVQDETRYTTMEALFNQRLDYYRCAHLTVNGLNLTPKALHTRIAEFIQK